MRHFLHESRSPSGGLVRTTFARGDGSSTGALTITPVLAGNATNGTGCLVLDGVNDWQQHSHVSGLSMTDGAGNDKAFTIAAWVYRTGTANEQCIACKEDYNGVNGSEWNLMLFTGRIQFVTAFQSGASGKVRRGNTSTVGLNTWTHVAATYDGSKTIAGIKLYYNGIEESSYLTALDTAAGQSVTAARLYFGINSGNQSPNYYDFQGKIMDVFMVEGGLTATEIYGLYIHGKDKTRP